MTKLTIDETYKEIVWLQFSRDNKAKNWRILEGVLRMPADFLYACISAISLRCSPLPGLIQHAAGTLAVSGSKFLLRFS
jgi:hypothetical protein